MPSKTRRTIVSAFLLLSMPVGSSMIRAQDGRSGVNLTPFDALARPGEPVIVRAKLSHDGPLGIHPNLRGYSLTFSGPTVPAREAVTAEEGIAEVAAQAPGAPGEISRVRVKFGGSRGHRPAEATARLFAWPAESPILVVDIDHTISDLRQRDVLFTENANIPALAGSVEALTRLSAAYRVLYLTARDESLINKTRAWLEAKGFPEGPLFTRDYGLFREGRREFKRRSLAELKPRFPNLTVGVGDGPEDVGAYLDNGMKALILAPGGVTFPHGEAIVVPSWQGVCDILFPG